MVHKRVSQESGDSPSGFPENRPPFEYLGGEFRQFIGDQAKVVTDENLSAEVTSSTGSAAGE